PGFQHEPKPIKINRKIDYMKGPVFPVGYFDIQSFEIIMIFIAHVIERKKDSSYVATDQDNASLTQYLMIQYL
ncbi:hypothetical protein ABI003_14995, partial [Enterococcus faecium]|uniref:hypothetical protein n=1 Tax=Enterococcus faecium TaxID=1352 RepID=UPI003F437D18